MRKNVKKQLALRVLSTAALMAMVSSIATAAFAEKYDLNTGSVTVETKDDGYTYVTQTDTKTGDFAQNSKGDTLDGYKDTDPKGVTITSGGKQTSNTITVETAKDQTTDVTLENVDIEQPDSHWSECTDPAPIEIKGNGNTNLELDGNNTVFSGNGKHAGIEKADVNGTGTLTIKDDKGKDGSLTAEGGDNGGAGIGGGLRSKGNDITVSGDTKLKVRGGVEDDIDGAGAGIGDGGSNADGSRIPGAEVEPDICALNPGGKIEYYAPRSSMSETPNKTVTNPTGDFVWDSGTVTTPATCTGKGVRTYTCTSSSHTKTEDIPALNHSFAGQAYVSDNNATCEQDGTKTAKCVRYGTGGCTETDTVTDTGSKLGHLFEDYVSNNDATYAHDGTKTAKCVRYDQCGETHTMPDEGSRLIAPPLYRVTAKDGKDIAYTAEQKGSVLTVTVDADFAVLTASLSGMTALRAQGVEKIIFVTNGAKTAVKLSAIISKLTANGVFRLTHDGKAATFTIG